MEKRKLNKEIDEIRGLIARNENVLATIPDGKLLCSQVGNHTVWRMKDGHDYKYLSKKKRNLASQLAEKKYLSKMQKHFKERLACLLRLQTIMNDEAECEEFFLGSQSPYRELICAKYKCAADRRKAVEGLKSNQNMFHSENLRFGTRSGHQVRSKIEVIIDDILFEMKLHYYYEPEITFGGKKVYPDFLIVNQDTAKVIILELFGMMDDRNYAVNAIEKMDLYARNGFMLGDSFIPLFETYSCPLNPEYVRRVLKHAFG